MKYIKILILIVCILNCHSNQELIRKDYSLDSNLNNQNYSISSFNESGQKVMILFTPTIWKTEILFDDENSLIHFFTKKDYRVYLIQMNPSKNHLDQAQEALRNLLRHIKISEYNLGGISTGGWHISNIYRGWSSDLPKASKIFFLGTGFDYNYPHSFPKQYDSFLENTNLHPYPRFFLNPGLVKYWKGGEIEVILPEAELNIPSDIPIAFYWGKIDSISPSESIYPIYRKLKNPKLWMELSIANGMAKDYDQGSLLLGDETTEDVFSEIERWLED